MSRFFVVNRLIASPIIIIIVLVAIVSFSQRARAAAAAGEVAVSVTVDLWFHNVYVWSSTHNDSSSPTTQPSTHEEKVRKETENDCPVSRQVPKSVTKSLCDAVGAALSSLCESFERRDDKANAPRFADDDDDQQRELRRLAASVFEHRGTCRRRRDGGNSDSESLARRWSFWCETHAAIVPPFSSSSNEEATIFFSAPATRRFSDDATTTTTTRGTANRERRSTNDAPPHPSCPRQRYLRCVRQRGDEDPLGGAWAWTASFFPPYVDDDNDDDDDDDDEHEEIGHRRSRKTTDDGSADDRYFEVEASTSLSGEGAHHTLHHDSRVMLFSSLGEKHRVLTIGGRYRGEITLALPLSEGVFVDLDDPSPAEKDHGCRLLATTGRFDHHSGSVHCRVELIPPVGRIVDVEQPSFASPQNMIAYRVSFDADAEEGGADDAANEEAAEDVVVAERAASERKHTFVLRLRFASTLHFRYQEPSVVATGGSSFFTNRRKGGYVVNVTVPSPFAIAGEIIVSSGENENGSGGGTTRYEFRPHDKMMMHPPPSVVIATGSQGDYWFVIITTGIVSLVGVLTAMKFIFDAGTWD